VTDEIPDYLDKVEALGEGSMGPDPNHGLDSTAPLSRRGSGEYKSDLMQRVDETFGRVMRAEVMAGIINLSTGDPLRPPPAAVREVYRRIIDRLVFDEGHDPETGGSYFQRESERIELHRYRVFPIVSQSLLRAAYAYFRGNGIPVSLGRAVDPRKLEILCGIGTTQLCVAALHAICDPGDVVLTPWPCYGLFGTLVTAMGADFRFIEPDPDNDFKMTPDGLTKALQACPTTRCVLISNPGNPTGSVYTVGEYEALAEVLERPENKHVWVLLDEVYDRTIFDPECRMVSFASLPGMYQRSVTVSGVAKNLGLAKLRVGYACGPRQVMWSMTGYSIATLGSIPETGQHVAAAALEGTPDSYYEANNKRYRRNLVRLTERVAEIDDHVHRLWGVERPCVALTNIPKAGFFVCIAFPGLRGRTAGGGKTLEDDFDLFDFLVKEARVTGVPGSSHGFPAEEMVLRYNFAVSKLTLEEAFDRIEQALLALS
jgi:aspartate/methionine/tyrosine aminotransferase